VLSLSSGDILVGISFELTFIQGYLSEESIVRCLGILSHLTNLMSLCISLYSLLLIAIDRFIAVIIPLTYRDRMTSSKAKLLIGCGWGCITITLITIYFYFGSTADINSIKYGGILDIIPQLIYVTFVSSQGYIALGLIIFCYIAIFIALHRQSRKIQNVQNSNANNDHRRTLQVTKTMALVLVTLLVTWTPVLVISTFFDPSYQDDDTLLWNVYDGVLSMILYSNSFMNGFIYAWRSRDFRQAYLSLLGCRKMTSKVDTTIQVQFKANISHARLSH
jgi:adenosine receptor A2b